MDIKQRDSILSAAIQHSVEKLANKGLDECTTKDVILASFGALSLHGGLATTEEVCSMRDEIKRCVNRLMGILVGVLVSVILTLIFM